MMNSRDDWTVKQSYDSTVPASQAVVEAVADATGGDEMSLEPLQLTIDADALNEVFRGDTADVSVSFTYVGCRVHVDPGTVVVRPEITG